MQLKHCAHARIFKIHSRARGSFQEIQTVQADLGMKMDELVFVQLYLNKNLFNSVFHACALKNSYVYFIGSV